MTEKSGNETIRVKNSTCIKDAQSVTLRDQEVKDYGRLSASGSHYSVDFSPNRTKVHTKSMTTFSMPMNESNNLEITTDPATTLGETSTNGKSTKGEAKKPVPEYDRHDLAKIFPGMREKSYEDLRADISKNGLLEPIVLYEEKILDGWLRALVCAELGIKPKYTPYEGTDPSEFLKSMNELRRHLTASQRAMIADRRANALLGGDLKSTETEPASSVSRKDVAAQADVSISSANQAAMVRAKAIPEVSAAIVAGKISLLTGVMLADLTKEQQMLVLALDDAEVMQKAASEFHKKWKAKLNTHATKIFKEIRETMGKGSKILTRLNEISEDLSQHNAELLDCENEVRNVYEGLLTWIRARRGGQVEGDSVRDTGVEDTTPQVSHAPDPPQTLSTGDDVVTDSRKLKPAPTTPLPKHSVHAHGNKTQSTKVQSPIEPKRTNV